MDKRGKLYHMFLYSETGGGGLHVSERIDVFFDLSYHRLVSLYSIVLGIYLEYDRKGDFEVYVRGKDEDYILRVDLGLFSSESPHYQRVVNKYRKCFKDYI